MTEDNGYAKTAPTRAEVDALPGATVLEFGTDRCGDCLARSAISADRWSARRSCGI